MNELNYLLLTIYFLCVTLVLLQIANSFNDEFSIRLDQKDLDQQLDDYKLKDAVEVKFKFDNRYEFHKLDKLAITVSNKSAKFPIYVDWDHSSLTDLDGRSRRVTRLVPGNTLDLLQTQVFSVIAPTRSLQEAIVAEDMLARKGDNGEVAIGDKKTLIDMQKPDEKKAPEPKKKRYRDFMDGKIDYEFYLDLVMRLVYSDEEPGGFRTRLRCKFIIKKLDWTAGLPWNPKK
jgi:hypothetical protein